jgi:hypothetical protein
MEGLYIQSGIDKLTGYMRLRLLYQLLFVVH